jgi:hypothetical protein
MGATSQEGTGIGSIEKLKPLIINGVVKAENLGVDILHNWKYDINATGDMTTESNVSAEGNITADGYIRGGANGQHLNTSFYTFDNGEVSNGDNNDYVDFASISYTPVSNSSSLYIEYNATYAVNGSNEDSFRSRIMVDETEITWRNQSWADSEGGGTRSAVLFPIAMVFSNSVTTALTIKIQAKRDGADDTITLNTNSAVLKVSEYAR